MGESLSHELGSRWPVNSEVRIGSVLGGVFGVWALLVGAVVAFSYVVFSTAPPAAVSQREVVIELSDFAIAPDVVEVFPNTELTFRIENSGDAQHDLTMSDRSTGRVKPGEKAVLEAGVVRKTFTVWCSIKGHRELGMVARVEVVDADG